MGYRSREATERDRWLTITEAMRHICRAESCDEREAEAQLDAALADGVVFNRWDEKPPIAGPGDQGPFEFRPVYSPSWFGPDRHKDEVLDDAGVTEEGRTLGYAVWRRLLLHREAVSSIWPLTHSTPSKGTAAAETACEKWLADMMSKSPKRPTASRKALLAQAQDRWEGLSENGFDRARAAAIKETGAEAWGKPGRPRKSPTQ